MYIAWPTEYKGDRSKNSVTLSNGKEYIPEKGKPPEFPCKNCHPKCNGGCREYMDYEHMYAAYKLAVFD